jgi:2-dehydro-3-deoxyphosphooctonate aldolase (KDO 8-P synthase)
MNKAQVRITDSLLCGYQQNLLLIAGPCQIESLEHSLMIASAVKKIADQIGLNFVFKASYDKANRTSLGGQRGLGIEKGLQILADVRSKLNVPILTDVHDKEQAKLAAEVVDILQTPAFLCRQTDLLIACGETGKCINVKKGQFLAPTDMLYAAEKIASTGNKNILLCERGTCFGYRELIVDMRALPQMRACGYPVVFDATHSVQSMGGAAGSSGGNREAIPGLAKAATAAGLDAIFLEVHEEPDRAPSDAASMLRLEELEELLLQISQIDGICNPRSLESSY